MHDDFQRCVRAVRSKDARFDGWFFTGVITTKIYCRPSCPVVPPKERNMRFFPTAAAAQSAGFRACKRCRPDASPASPEWNVRADLAARAMRLIADGVVDREGVPGLARRLGYSTRQIERQLRAELGAGPLALARAQRAQTARVLIETTHLPISQVAFGSGFSSIRTFNETVREVFGASPSQLRAAAVRRAGVPAAGVISVRLPFRAPLAVDALFVSLATEALRGVEEWRDGAFRRTLRLPQGPAIVELREGPGHIRCKLALSDVRDLATAITRCRFLLDLDADPEAVDAALTLDPGLRPLVAGSPGRRVPRTVDGEELAIRAVAGSDASALASAFGDEVADPDGGLTHVFPSAAQLTDAGLDTPGASIIRSLSNAIVSGSVDLSAGGDWRQVRTSLGSSHGLDELTVETIAMRALGDPDAFVSNGHVRSAADALGIASTPEALSRRSQCWRPWRAYAVAHLSAVAASSAGCVAPKSTGRRAKSRTSQNRPAGAIEMTAGRCADARAGSGLWVEKPSPCSPQISEPVTSPPDSTKRVARRRD